MTVKVIQRIPDKDTLERHDAYKNDVKAVKVYEAFSGMFVLHLILRDGQGLHFHLEFYDFEIMED